MKETENADSNKDFVVVEQHPDLDYLYSIFGDDDVLTKQDKYKLLEDWRFINSEVDSTIDSEDIWQLFTKKRGDKSHQLFEQKMRDNIREATAHKSKYPFLKPTRLEAIIYVYLKEKRYNKVDVDNLAKSILDCFNGLVFEDDSQIETLLVKKVPFPHYNALIVGIRILDNKESWFKDIHLLSFKDGEKPKEWLI